MIKKIAKFIFFIIIIMLIFSGIRYLYIKNTYTKPYVVVDNVIQEALNDEIRSNYIITEEEWQLLSEDSAYKLIREPLNWIEFKEFVNESKESSHALLYNNGIATYKIMKNGYKNNQRIIIVQTIEYSEDNLDLISIKYTNLLMQNINGSWKIIGQEQTGSN